jgi:hypothetical protein
VKGNGGTKKNAWEDGRLTKRGRKKTKEQETEGELDGAKAGQRRNFMALRIAWETGIDPGSRMGEHNRAVTGADGN